jgi:hypothetical protein
MTAAESSGSAHHGSGHCPDTARNAPAGRDAERDAEHVVRKAVKRLVYE